MLVRALIALALAFGLASASAQVKIGLMVSATGPTSAIGIPQKNTAALLPARIGEEDGRRSTECTRIRRARRASFSIRPNTGRALREVKKDRRHSILRHPKIF